MTEQNPLAALPLFAGLSPADLEILTRSLRTRRYRKGEVIFHKDDAASSLFIVNSGSVRISVTSTEGKELIVAVLREFDYFGELALLDDLPRSADAVAIDTAELLVLQRDAFLGLLKSSADAATRLLAALSQQLRRTTDQLQDAAFLDVPTRLLRQLLVLSSTNPEGNTGVRLTQSQLGAMVGASRESVNKWLRNYERRGLIKRSKAGLEVLRPDEISRLIDAAVGM